jgi:AcrR family transcriptional regulator
MFEVMKAYPETTTEPRRPLTRDRVLRAAVRLADEGGFESLTMRRLGQELGVQAMSLYNHVAGKDDIRDGIVDIVMSEIEPPSAEVDWKAAIRASAISAHEAFMRHPWACGLEMQAARVTPARLEWSEGILQTFREAGFSAELTHHAYHALESHITGFTLWVVNMPFDTHEELVDLAKDFLRDFPKDRYPYFVEHAEWHIAEQPDPDEPGEFEFGLDLILDGLERARDSG